MKTLHNRFLKMAICLMPLLLCISFAGCETSQPTPQPEIPYGDANPLNGAGAELPADAFAMQLHPAEKDDAVEMTPQELIQCLRENRLEPGTYLVASAVELTGLADLQLDGHQAVVFLEQGLQMTGCERVTICNLVCIGSVQLTDSCDIALHQVDVQCEQGTMVVDADSRNIRLEDCRITARSGTALLNQADNFTLSGSVICYGKTGLLDQSTSGLTVQNCLLTGEGTAVETNGRDVSIRGNTIEAGENATGVILHGGNVYDSETGTLRREVEAEPVRYVLHNGLIAENTIRTARCEILLDGVTNTAAILNSVTSVEVRNGHSIYVCDNELGATLTATNVEYLLADGNQYPEDGYPHDPVTTNLLAPSGDTLLEIDARLECGVDETLLPQVDRDLFVGAETKTTVRDAASLENDRTVDVYLSEEAGQTGVHHVILPPGKYAAQETIRLGGNGYDETVVYGYGVYLEKSTGLEPHLNLSGVNGLTVKGVTFAFAQQSCGQVHVLKKLGANRILVVTGAGMINEFGNTDSAYFNTTSIGLQRRGTFFASCDASYNSIVHSDDLEHGTMRITLGGDLYQKVQPGDVLT